MRHLPNWIHGFHFWMQEQEAPNSFINWAAVSAIAGATQRQVWVPEGHHRYYCNHYIMFVGPQGVVHKGTVIEEVRKMFRALNIATSSESLSREALIDQMIKRGDAMKGSIITCLPDELSDMLRTSGNSMIEFLTTIYGCQDNWEYSTRMRGTEIMEKAFLNLLGGTTPAWIAAEFDGAFVDQGFVGRTLWLNETEPRFLNARPKVTPEMQRCFNHLLDDLAHITSLSGAFEWEPAAEPWYDHWYEKVNQQERKAADYRLKGHYARRQVHMQKLAMVLQLAKSDELVITLENLKQAKIELDLVARSSSDALSSVGKNIFAGDMERIYGDIVTLGGLPLSQIAQRNSGALQYEDIIKQITLLRVMKKIRSEQRDGEVWYLPI